MHFVLCSYVYIVVYIPLFLTNIVEWFPQLERIGYKESLISKQREE